MSAIGDAWGAVETKVKAASTAAFVTSMVVSALADVLHGPVPVWVPGVAGSLVTALATALAGWMAAHTPRVPDIPDAARTEPVLVPVAAPTAAETTGPVLPFVPVYVPAVPVTAHTAPAPAPREPAPSVLARIVTPPGQRAPVFGN